MTNIEEARVAGAEFLKKSLDVEDVNRTRISHAHDEFGIGELVYRGEVDVHQAAQPCR